MGTRTTKLVAAAVLISGCSMLSLENIATDDPPIPGTNTVTSLGVYAYEQSKTPGSYGTKTRTTTRTGRSEDRSLIDMVIAEFGSHRSQWNSGTLTPPIFQNRVDLWGGDKKLMTISFSETWARAEWENKGKKAFGYVTLAKERGGALIQAVKSAASDVQIHDF
jgi:hypothetical protein